MFVIISGIIALVTYLILSREELVCGKYEIIEKNKCVEKINQIFPDLKSINDCKSEKINGEIIEFNNESNQYYFESLK